MIATALFTILALSAPSTLDGLWLRIRVALACADAAETEREAVTCARIAHFEGQWRDDVALCRVLGAIGERGAWQVLARNTVEARDACTLDGGARLGVERVRESLAVCGDLTGYVSGRCGYGLREARERWGP